MRIVSRFLMALAAPLLLTGCLWSPGKFASTLMLHKSGRFVLDYKGEILLQLPDDMDAKRHPWDPKMARCSKTEEPSLSEAWQIHLPESEAKALPDEARGNSSDDDVRPCTATETAALKKQYDLKENERVAKDRKEKEEMAKVFGLPGVDDAASRAFAERLKKYAGWREVTFRGNGVFHVNYHLEGQLTHDLVFPLMPDSQFLMPFITIRRRGDGAVLVQAPALGGSSNPMLNSALTGAMRNASKDKAVGRAQGRFTVITDGEILTNNSEEGPQAHNAGRQVHWDVAPAVTAKVPEMLVRL